MWIQNLLFVIIFSLTVAGVMFGLFWYNSGGIESAHPTALVSPIKVLPTPVPEIVTSPAVTDKSAEIKQAIQQIVDAKPELNLGVSFINLTDNSRVDVNGDKVFVAASTTKVLIGALLLSQVEAGQIKLDQPLDNQTVGQELQLMINQSNNDDWESLMSLIGFNLQPLYAEKIGITTYDSVNNQISPNDMALVLAKLYTGQLLNSEDTALLLSYMKNTNMEELIPPAVPDGILVYHKYGTFNDTLHDAAIIDDGKTPFVLVIYSSLGTGSISYSQRVEIFHQIVTAVEKINGIKTD